MPEPPAQMSPSARLHGGCFLCASVAEAVLFSICTEVDERAPNGEIRRGRRSVALCVGCRERCEEP